MPHLTDAQHGIWFTERSGAAATAYHLALTVELTGALDVAAFEAACRSVIAGQEALRLAVRETEAGPVLVQAPRQPELARIGYRDDLVAELVAEPFDLATGPLVRMVLAERDPHRHLLVVVAHHLVFDGASKDILVRELAAAYRPGTAVAETADPAVVERSALEPGTAEPVLADARAFWSGLLTEVPREALLPGLRGTPQAATAGAVVACDLDAGATAGLDAAASAAGVSRFEWLLTAVGVLLRRYGEPAPVVAVDVSTRPRGATETIGLFVNELPVPLPDPGDATFAEAAARVRALLRQIYRYRSVPAGRVIGGLRPTTAMTPVSVSYRRRSAGTPTFAGLHAEVDWSVPTPTARNALHLHAVDDGERISLRLAFPPALLDPAAAGRIGGHLGTLLAASAAAPHRRVDELPILPAEEYRLLIELFNDTGRPYPCDRTTLDRLFAERVALHPQAGAVIFDDVTWSYAELDARVERTAAHLRQAGVSGGDLVAVRLPRSAELLVTVLAVGRVGAAYLPVDPAYPQARQTMILDDAKPVLVVTPEWLAARSDPAPGRAIAADRGPDDGFAPGAGPDDLAYVMYTSGSTGQPKGVEVPRSALVNLLLSLRDDIGSGGGDVWLALTSLAFDIAAVELYLPLITGARLVIAPESVARDGAAINQLIRTAGVTHAQATPSGWRMLLETGFGAGVDPDDRLVALVGGEALPLALARPLRAGTRRLFNVYGPTETTIWSTIEEIPADPTEITIGRPLANTSVYVLDAEDRPVPLGVEGDLVIGGWGVARGYLGRAGLTAERFVADPFHGGQARMYRTGDRARWLPDGRIEFLGRSDNQIKIRGHRVELGEIEGRLLEHPAVAQAAVALRGPADESGDPSLVAYVVPGAGGVDPGRLREHLLTTLPVATVPTAWVWLDRLPLTPNGKLDRAALPAPTAGTTETPAVPDTPADPVTEEVRTIWQDVLGIPDIAVDEDLFDLGGHSLTITRISARITKRLGVTVPLDLFYDTPTIAEIAEAVRARKEAR